MRNNACRKTLLNVAAWALCAFGPVVALGGSVELTPAEEVGMSPTRLEELRVRLEELVTRGQTAGIQVLIARRGKVVLHENFGVENITTGAAVNDDTLFRIYSLTKPVTGVAMMLLYEEGLFSLGDPIAKYVPEFAGLMVYDGQDESGEITVKEPTRPPTMHDLLQHTAGFTYGWFGDTPVDRLYNERQVLDPDSGLQTMIDKLAQIPLLHQPGSQWHYSIAADIQGYIVEKLSGQDLATFMQTRIFAPLGMDETFGWLQDESSRKLASVHTHTAEGNLIVDDGFWSADYYSPPGLFMGGAQLVSTTDDYWRFAQMLLNRGTFAGIRILSPAIVDMMTTNRLPDTVPGRVTTPGTGFGFDLAVVTDESLINMPASNGEYSWSGAATTIFWVDPAEQLVALLFTQYVPWDAPRYEDLLHRLVRSAIID